MHSSYHFDAKYMPGYDRTVLQHRRRESGPSKEGSYSPLGSSSQHYKLVGHMHEPITFHLDKVLPIACLVVSAHLAKVTRTCLHTKLTGA